MRNTAIGLCTLLCVPLASVLIANAPVAVAESVTPPSACSGNFVTPSTVRTAANAGAVRGACSPIIPTRDAILWQRRH
jgi:hypothetical protein